jgi:hypothetical protein
MNTKRNLALVLFVIAALIGGAVPHQMSVPRLVTAYVEPTLPSLEAETLSVIVTADDPGAAARAVERVGGQVTTDLWLIDAVAATLPASQLEALAVCSGVQSIVNNKAVYVVDDDDDVWVPVGDASCS